MHRMTDRRDNRDFEVSTWKLVAIIAAACALSGVAVALLADEDAAVAVVGILLAASALLAHVLTAHLPR
jgi:hypothetical protein